MDEYVALVGWWERGEKKREKEEKLVGSEY